MNRSMLVFHAKRFRQRLCLYFAATALALAPAYASTGYEEQEKSLKENADFAVHLHTHEVEHFLQYKGSTMNPITSVDISFAMRDLKTREYDEPKKYEDLWFHDRHAVGVMRYEHLQLKAGTHGVVFIDETKDAEKSTSSIANAMVRILLDSHLQEANVTFVVPQMLYQRVAEDLAVMRFHEVHKLSSQQHGILFHMTSIPESYDKYFWFEKY